MGGRQSAFEWAGLIRGQGAAQIHICYRHGTPRFEPSDWGWADEMIENTLHIRGWFQHLSDAERQSIQQRFWAEGRLKLEPWLRPLLEHDNIKLWPRTNVVDCKAAANGGIQVRLDIGDTLEVDQVILATGYRVDLSTVPYLSELANTLSITDGYPDLNEDFESSLPGLFLPGQVAIRDFGPFFGFVLGCPAAARIIVDCLRQRTGG